MSNNDLQQDAKAMASYYGHRMRAAELRLSQAMADGDDSGRFQALADMAAVRAEATAFQQMAGEYERSMQPPARPLVDLTPDEAAKICGLTAEEYNRGVSRLLEMKSRGAYQEGKG